MLSRINRQKIVRLSFVSSFVGLYLLISNTTQATPDSKESNNYSKKSFLAPCALKPM